MKRLLLIVLTSLSLYNFSVQAQATSSCGFKIPPKSVLKSQFQSVYEAAGIVNSMLDSIDWEENFRLREQNGINNAYATIIQNMRYIVYDNDFLENLDAYAATKWASISVLAHEMGHHYYNHMVTGRGSTVPVEIEADGFSGYVMNKIGATLEQSIAAMQAIASDKASATHPAKKDRLAAITRGWNAARNTGTPIPENTPPGNTGNTDPKNDATWIGLTIQSSKTETVYLSDDGKAYQPAELKAGEPFIFKFEIYNYGWLRLPYSNGYRTFKLVHGKDYSILWNRRTRNWTLVEVPQ
jgi:hypothetical protein